MDSPTDWTHAGLTLGRLKLHYVHAGRGEGRPLVVLLHGFPEFWYSWRLQIPALVAAGCQVVVPDMRGYNLSDKPTGIDHYQIENLVDDVAGLMDASSAQQAHIVGHDWGGIVAWFFAMRYPSRTKKLIVMDAAHPAAYLRELKGPRQLIRSWYVFMFQVPKFAETMLKLTRYRGLRKTFEAAGFSEADIDQYETAWRQPGAMAAGVNYYRAIFRRVVRGTLQKIMKPIDMPTMLIWGEQDPFATLRVTQDLEPWVKDLRVEILPGIGHWVQNQAPERVNELLLEFLGSD